MRLIDGKVHIRFMQVYPKLNEMPVDSEMSRPWQTSQSVGRQPLTHLPTRVTKLLGIVENDIQLLVISS